MGWHRARPYSFLQLYSYAIYFIILIFPNNGIDFSSSLIAILLVTALAGALTGFLPFNFNPAKTFMGDVGSNF